MDAIVRIALFLCVLAAIVSEIITIAVPEMILGITELDPQQIFASRFYRAVFVLSGFYLCAVVLMFVSGDGIFQAYALLLVALSLVAWFFRRIFLRLRVVQVAESTVCLVVLIDTARTIVRAYLS